MLGFLFYLQQLHMDVAWDMFILPAIVMFAVLAWRQLRFGKLMGGLGMVFGLGGLFLNIWTFPTPPINVGLPDVGPFAMVWYAVFFALVFTQRNHSHEVQDFRGVSGVASDSAL